MPLDIETDTRWGGTGPRVDFGLSYVAPITVIGIAWEAGGAIQSLALAAISPEFSVEPARSSWENFSLHQIRVLPMSNLLKKLFHFPKRLP